MSRAPDFLPIRFTISISSLLVLTAGGGAFAAEAEEPAGGVVREPAPSVAQTAEPAGSVAPADPSAPVDVTAAVPPPPPPPPPVAPIYPPPAYPYPGQPYYAPPAYPYPPAAPPPPAPVASDATGDQWYDLLDFGAFADAYYGVNYNFPKPHADANAFRLFDQDNGFALSWVGADVSYPALPVGGTLSLRFGPSAGTFARGGESALGLDVVKQGYASWKPGGKACVWTLDFGKFDTIYGIEEADSQLNFNYTRGFLKTLVQPFSHTGLRAQVDASENFKLSGLIVNGWDNSLDNNAVPSVGIKLGYVRPDEQHARDQVEFHVGYLIGPEQPDVEILPCELDESDNSCVPNIDPASEGTPVGRSSSNSEGLRHFLDLGVMFNPSDEFSLGANGSLLIENERHPGTNIGDPGSFESAFDWGLAVLGRYEMSSIWAGGLRLEAVSLGRTVNGTDLGPDRDRLYSGTLTIEAVPVEHLILRLDNRIDGSDEEAFNQNLRSMRTWQLTTTLGVVVTTN